MVKYKAGKYEIGVTPKSSKYHYVNIVGIETHKEALEIKRLLKKVLK